MPHTSYRGPRRCGPKPADGPFHDLTNCVHGIAMAVELALDDDAGLPEQHRVYLREIRCRCRELKRLTQHLRGLVRQGDAYSIVCTHCEENILTAPHIGDAEMRAMLEHVRRAHPELL